MNEFLIGINKRISKIDKLILALCLTLPLQTMASEAVDNELETPIEVGDTIAGMTVTQASIDDVDRLMGDMKKAETFAEMMTPQNQIVIQIYGEYCKREMPELSEAVNQAVNSWVDRINPKLKSMYDRRLNDDNLTLIPSDIHDKLLKTMRREFIAEYLITQRDASPKSYCPALIERLNSTEADYFVSFVEHQYYGSE